MEPTAYPEVDALKELLTTKLTMGSPTATQSTSPPPTVRKTIQIKLKKKTTPTTSPTSVQSPTHENEDGSSEPPTLDFSQVSAALEQTEQKERTEQAIQQKEESGSVALLDVQAKEPAPLVQVVAESAPVPVAFPFPLPDYKRWIVEFKLIVLIAWIAFPFKEYFVKVAEIELDVELQKKSTKTKLKGEKARQSLICFSRSISSKEFSEEAEWIYIFLVDGKIVKIGGTRAGLLKRCGSYLSGHNIPELNGKSNSTNAYIYWTFLHLLLQGKKVEMYACRLPEAVVTMTSFGITKTIKTQSYHDWEAYCLEEYAKLYGNFPPLSDNCDPRYREKGNGKKKGKAASKK